MVETNTYKKRSSGVVTVSVKLSEGSFGWCWRNALRIIQAGLILGLFGRVTLNINHDNPRINHG